MKAERQARENETKTDDLVQIKLDEPNIPANIIVTDQPLRQWSMYEENLYVEGNVYLIYNSLNNKRIFPSYTTCFQP